MHGRAQEVFSLHRDADLLAKVRAGAPHARISSRWQSRRNLRVRRIDEVSVMVVDHRRKLDGTAVTAVRSHRKEDIARVDGKVEKEAPVRPLDLQLGVLT